MQNKPTLATHKIIFLVVFISAAIMTSLFVFHKGRGVESSLSPDEGFIFSPTREIKPFQLISTNNKKFTQNDLRDHITLLFFGFTHCPNICPTTLNVLNRIYMQLQIAYPHLQVVFISLDPERDTPAVLSKYMQSFNSKFIGVTGEISELRKLQSELGIFSARSDSNGDNYQIQHTSSILLIDPQGKWAGLFNYGMSPEKLANAINKAIVSLKI